MEERAKQLQAKLEADAGLAGKLMALETPEEVQALLKAEGLEFSLEEINDIKAALVSLITKQAGGEELSDEDLENVAGGSITVAGVGAAAALITAVSGGVAAVTVLGGGVDTWTRGRW